MELHQLKYFCAVARVQSFTRAAEEERVAQPSLSQQIQKLETEVGAPLFLRLGRSVRLTEFGEAFLPKARIILHEVEVARRVVDDLQDDIRSKLTLGVIPTIMPYFVAPHLTDFTTQYPNGRASPVRTHHFAVGVFLARRRVRSDSGQLDGFQSGSSLERTVPGSDVPAGVA